MRSTTAAHHKKRLRTDKSSGLPRKQSTPSVPPPIPVRAQLRVQECSFVQWDVSGISALAASLCANFVALARANGSIELRSRQVRWAVISCIYGDAAPENTVSAIKFSNCTRFLFVARLDGSLLVFRVTPEGLIRHVVLAPGGGALWDIAVSQNVTNEQVKLALACDDGCVRFVHADPEFVGADPVSGEKTILPSDTAHYITTISEATNARAISVAWAPPAPGRDVDCVATGDTEGGVRWINPDNGRLYGRGKLPSVRREQTAIWTMNFAREGKDLVCGDSRGMATVWSSASNTLKQEVRVEALRGALWSSTLVADSPNSEIVFFGCAAGGVGGLRSPSIGAEDEMWVPLRGCRFHSHDVRGMASFPSGEVLSGSLDARMCLFTPGEFIDKRKIEWILPYHGCVGQPPVKFSRDHKFILSRRQKGIDLWSIPDDSQSPPLKLRMKLKSFESDLNVCAISTDGSLVSASSLGSFRLYQIWDKQGEIGESTSFGKVKPLEVAVNFESVLIGAFDMCFCRQTLVCILKCKETVALYENGRMVLVKKEEIGSSALSLERIACVDGRIAISDSRGQVFSSKLESDWSNEAPGLLWTNVFSPPQEVSQVTAMSFSPSGEKIAIGTSDFKVFVSAEGSDEQGCVTAGPFSCVITSMSFSDNEESLLVSGEKFCSVVCALHSSRKRKLDEDSQGAGFEPHSLRVGDSILGSCVLGPSRIALVRRRWDLVQYSSSLPDAIPKKPFGT